MKNFLFAAALMLFSTISFAQTSTDLIGKWKLTGMPETENMDKATQEQFKKAVMFTLDLKKDAKFSLSAMSKVVSGTWKLKGKVIELYAKATKKTSTLTISKYLKSDMHVLMNGHTVILSRSK